MKNHKNPMPVRQYQIDPEMEQSYLKMIALKRELADALEECQFIERTEAAQILARQVRTIYLELEDFCNPQAQSIAEVMRDLEKKIWNLPD